MKIEHELSRDEPLFPSSVLESRIQQGFAASILGRLTVYKGVGIPPHKRLTYIVYSPESSWTDGSLQFAFQISPTTLADLKIVGPFDMNTAAGATFLLQEGYTLARQIEPTIELSEKIGTREVSIFGQEIVGVVESISEESKYDARESLEYIDQGIHERGSKLAKQLDEYERKFQQLRKKKGEEDPSTIETGVALYYTEAQFLGFMSGQALLKEALEYPWLERG